MLMRRTALLVLLSAETAYAFTVGRRSVPPSPAASSTAAFGLLDEINSDSYDLLGSSDETDVNMNDSYEMFLADLVFSTNDPRVDIMNKFDLASDDKFVDWLDAKIENSKDPEERIALRDLYDIIIDVKTRVEVNKLAEERKAQEEAEAEEARVQAAEAEADAGRSMSNAEVLRKAAKIQTAESEDAKQEKKTFYDEELTPEIRLSYESMLKKVLPPYKAGDTFASIVFKNYEQFDAQFVKVLNERANNGDSDSTELLAALATEQSKRIAEATETLKQVLSLGDPMKMEGEIVKMAREGKVNEAFLLLLEANENQARAAGATAPADLMQKLRKRAADETDKQNTKEIALVRKLLRTDEASEREALLEDAFTPRENLLVAGSAENAQKAMSGEAQDKQEALPDVPPPDFINACKAVLLNFGNLGDENNLANRIRKIAGEAEVVATRIYGKSMTLKEQQDRMWEEQTTSIFDLERMEIEAEQNGETAPWANENADDMMMPGFDANGKMTIGGS